MKMCGQCEGSGNHFYMKDGKQHWKQCRSCGGKGVIVPFTDPTDAIALEEYLEQFERDGGLRA